MEEAPKPIAEIEHGPSKFDQILEAHQKKLVIAAILVFLGVLAFVFFKKYNEYKREQAGAKTVEANTEKEYEAVYTEYPGTPSAGAATLLIANSRTKAEDAIKSYNHFISNYPEHPAVPLAQFRLAMHQINADKLSDATATLELIINNDEADYLIPRAKISLGEIALHNGEKEKAKALFTEARDYKGNDFTQLATQKLVHIDAVKPILVDAPTPAPKEETPAPKIKIDESKPKINDFNLDGNSGDTNPLIPTKPLTPTEPAPEDAKPLPAPTPVEPTPAPTDPAPESP